MESRDLKYTLGKGRQEGTDFKLVQVATRKKKKKELRTAMEDYSKKRETPKVKRKKKHLGGSFNFNR